MACMLFTGGLAEEVDEKMLNAAFIPFGDILDIQIPLDYETGFFVQLIKDISQGNLSSVSEKHRGFAFIEYEVPEDCAAAIDNMVSE